MVTLKIKVPYEEESAVRKEITEATAGRAQIEKIADAYYRI